MKLTRCHLVLYLFLPYKLLNMFRATLCPSSGADDIVVFLPLVVYCHGCVGCQIRLAGCVSIGEYVAQRATYSPVDTWHYTTRSKNTTKSSAPEDGHKVARNMLSNL